MLTDYNKNSKPFKNLAVVQFESIKEKFSYLPPLKPCIIKHYFSKKTCLPV
jgi:hypothetical protein